MELYDFLIMSSALIRKQSLLVVGDRFFEFNFLKGKVRLNLVYAVLQLWGLVTSLLKRLGLAKSNP